MHFQSFSGVIFVTFFDTAFSNKGCCCKVRHARILWFLQWILTIFKFHVFLENGKKHEISSRISMQKTSEIQCRIALKSDAKNMKIYEKSMKIDTRKPTFEKRGSEVRFLMDLGYFWGSVGSPKSLEVVKKGIQGGTQKTVKKKGSETSARQVEKAMFLSKHLISTTLSIKVSSVALIRVLGSLDHKNCI